MFGGADEEIPRHTAHWLLEPQVYVDNYYPMFNLVVLRAVRARSLRPSFAGRRGIFSLRKTLVAPPVSNSPWLRDDGSSRRPHTQDKSNASLQLDRTAGTRADLMGLLGWQLWGITRHTGPPHLELEFQSVIAETGGRPLVSPWKSGQAGGRGTNSPRTQRVPR